MLVKELQTQPKKQQPVLPLLIHCWIFLSRCFIKAGLTFSAHICSEISQSNDFCVTLLQLIDLHETLMRWDLTTGCQHIIYVNVDKNADLSLSSNEEKAPSRHTVIFHSLWFLCTLYNDMVDMERHKNISNGLTKLTCSYKLERVGKRMRAKNC